MGHFVKYFAEHTCTKLLSDHDFNQQKEKAYKNRSVCIKSAFKKTFKLDVIAVSRSTETFGIYVKLVMLNLNPTVFSRFTVYMTNSNWN